MLFEQSELFEQLNCLCQYVWMCIYPHAHKCEMNIEDICSCVHVYMQIGVYITLFAYVHVCGYMCGNGYVNTCNIWMMHVCGCINACRYKYICV